MKLDKYLNFSIQLQIDQCEIEGAKSSDIHTFSQLVDLKSNCVNNFTLPTIEVLIPPDGSDEELVIKIIVD